MKRPDIDIGACTLCMGCVEICPEVFRFNDAGYIEVIDLQEYSEKDIDYAIMLCPEDCISWLDD
jgi:ferredoxin